MSWQLAICLQVLVSSVMTIVTRRVTLSTKQLFFGIGAISYLTILCVGMVDSRLFLGRVPALPTGQAWIYLLVEGICIPAAWLLQYQIIRYSGAGNAAIASTLGSVTTAIMGVLLLGDRFGKTFAIGAVLITVSVILSMRIHADTRHRTGLDWRTKAALALAGALLYAVGMFAEKRAIDTIGVWHYTTYGWGMQAAGALLIFTLLGRHELKLINSKAVAKAIVIGAITALSGSFYVYALSRGELSKTIIATSGKVAITLVLAAIVLHERNALRQRIVALALSIAGLLLIVR